ncbi:MAG: hypothetical protein FWC82_01815 [Firmicutes bacterium]|nr:hypothetical protein [Bacillota bacterium]
MKKQKLFNITALFGLLILSVFLFACASGEEIRQPGLIQWDSLGQLAMFILFVIFGSALLGLLVFVLVRKIREKRADKKAEANLIAKKLDEEITKSEEEENSIAETEKSPNESFDNEKE